MECIEIKADLNDANSYIIFVSESGQKIPVLYEDNHLIVAIKPEGVLSQSDGTFKPDMLTLLKEYIKKEHLKTGEVFLGLVHRLDMPVSGIMVFAKTSKGASRISEQIRERRVTKKYYAIILGTTPEKQGKLQAKLLKKAGNIVYEDEEGKEAVLYYNLLETNIEKNLSLLDITLETGRAHQIRTQLSMTGNPILGDRKYGANKDDYHGGIALFSYLLQFKHPTRDLQMEFKAIPEFKSGWNIFESTLKHVIK